MKILVAGGTGFMGAHIVSAFADSGHTVSSLARRPGHAGREDVTYRVGDLGNIGDLGPSMEDVDVAVFAVTTSTPGSASNDSAFDASSNLVNAIHFLEAAAAAHVERLVLISSAGTVYGVPSVLPIPESHATDPISSYGVTKLAIEKYFGAYAATSQARATVLRVGNAFGEGQVPGTGQGAAAAFISALLREEPVEIWGDGSIVRDYVYAADVAVACVAAVEREQPERVAAVNIGTGVGHSLLELLDLCSAATGRVPDVVLRPGRAFDVPEIVLDIGRAQSDLGWRPATDLPVGLAREAEWLERLAGRPA